MFVLRTCTLALLALAFLAQPAHAQGLLQNLLGFETSPGRNLPPSAGYRYPRSVAPGQVEDLFEGEAPHPEPTYRTVCVRMCDGYYFPISFATTRRGFAADAQKCSESCRGGQLFFHANPGEEISSARDFTGLQYDLLPNAFRYRKALVEGCECRPQPWTEEERQRHSSYVKLVRRPAPPPAAPAAATEEPAERPLALLRRGAPEPAQPRPTQQPAADEQNGLEQAAPPPLETPSPRRRPPRRQQADIDLFAPVKTILFGVPAKPPRR